MNAGCDQDVLALTAPTRAPISCGASPSGGPPVGHLFPPASPKNKTVSPAISHHKAVSINKGTGIPLPLQSLGY